VRDALWGGRRDAFLIGGGSAFCGRDWYRRRGKTFRHQVLVFEFYRIIFARFLAIVHPVHNGQRGNAFSLGSGEAALELRGSIPIPIGSVFSSCI
jgi:hypothetical protein